MIARVTEIEDYDGAAGMDDYDGSAGIDDYTGQREWMISTVSRN